MIPRRDLCDAAKRGKLCIDDLCHNGGETLCGFDPDLYADMLDENYNWPRISRRAVLAR